MNSDDPFIIAADLEAYKAKLVQARSEAKVILTITFTLATSQFDNLMPSQVE